MKTKRKIIHRDRITQYLIANPWSSTLEMSTALRISNVSARLSELWKMGVLEKANSESTDADGYTTHFKRYAIKEVEL